MATDARRHLAEGRVVVDHGAVCRITLNAPEALNAVDAETLNAMASVVEQAAADPLVRVVVLTGEGRAFCAGANLGTDPAAMGGGPDTSTIDAANRLIAALIDAPVPVVCALNGLAAGVGVSIALACDVVVAHESAYLLLAFTRIGLMPDGGATALVAAAAGRNRALALALLADRLSVEEALRHGLVHSVSGDDLFASEVERIVGQLANGPTQAYAETKRAINAASIPDLAGVLERERDGQTRLMSSADFAEGADAFRAKRSPSFSGRPE